MSDAVLAALITSGLGFVGIVVTVIIAPRWKAKQDRDDAKAAAQGKQAATNLEEAHRLRAEAWRLKEEAERDAEECRAEAEKWRRAFWFLWQSANRMLSRCASSVGTALSFLEDERHDPAKRELTRLDSELKQYHLPEAPEPE
jgi:hypothetical protein